MGQHERGASKHNRDGNDWGQCRGHGDDRIFLHYVARIKPECYVVYARRDVLVKFSPAVGSAASPQQRPSHPDCDCSSLLQHDTTDHCPSCKWGCASGELQPKRGWRKSGNPGAHGDGKHSVVCALWGPTSLPIRISAGCLVCSRLFFLYQKV